MGIFELTNQKRAISAADRYVEAIVAALINQPKTTPLTLKNRVLWPPKAGVYALYHRDKLEWVGESGKLSERAKDLFRTKNHTFRRLLGAKLFSKRPDFAHANSKNSFSLDIEIALTKYMEEHFTFVVVPVSIGRKEIEERTCARSKGLLNIKKQRGT